MFDLIDVIGGAADGTKSLRGVSAELQSEPYIALEFPIDEKDKKTVTIYMRCGMTPLDAMRIWRERNMTDEAYEKLKSLTEKLLAAGPAEIEAEGKDNFIEYCERALESLRDAGMRTGRGELMVELGLTITGLRNGTISAGTKLSASNSHSKPKARTKKPRAPAGIPKPPHPDPYGMASALPIPGHLSNDPDDEEW